jgi:hypothetical protein
MKKQKIFKHLNTRNIFLLLVFLGIVIFGTTSCEKIPKHYLHKWTGNWDFEIEKSWWGMGMESSKIDTSYYSGTISIGNDPNQLNINFMEGYSELVDVDKSGKISKANSYSKGQFEKNNKVYFEYGILTAGSSFTCKINGIKKKGGK